MTELINTFLNTAEQEETSKITGRGRHNERRQEWLVVTVQSPSILAMANSRFIEKFKNWINRQGYCSRIPSSALAVFQTTWLKAGIFVIFFKGSPVKQKLQFKTTVWWDGKKNPNNPPKKPNPPKTNKSEGQQNPRVSIWLDGRKS